MEDDVKINWGFMYLSIVLGILVFIMSLEGMMSRGRAREASEELRHLKSECVLRDFGKWVEDDRHEHRFELNPGNGRKEPYYTVKSDHYHYLMVLLNKERAKNEVLTDQLDKLNKKE